MSKKKFNVDVENFEILDSEYSDDQLAIVEVYVCHDGNNRHNVPISRQALNKAKDTLKNKFLVAGFDGKDFEGHEPDEMIIGFFPESSKMSFKLMGGKTYLVAQAIMSKIYAKWAYEIFMKDGNHKDVSMEITVLKGDVDEFDNLLTIEEFVFNGVTILGSDHVPACEGSSASIIKFDCENALKVYNKHRDETAVVKFSGKEEEQEMNESEKVVETETVEVTVEQENVENVEVDGNDSADFEDTAKKDKSSKEDDDKTMYSEDDKKDESESDESEETEEKSEEDVVEENATEENLPTENCEVDENEVEDSQEEVDVDALKAERDSLLAECKELKEKVEKYEASEKSLKVESILSEMIEVFTTDEISELRELSAQYSLDNLTIFDNEVKAKAFDKMKDQKPEKKNFTKVAINDVIEDSKNCTSKYTW